MTEARTVAYQFDREAYTDAKEPFVRRTVELALVGCAQLEPD